MSSVPKRIMEIAEAPPRGDPDLLAGRCSTSEAALPWTRRSRGWSREERLDRIYRGHLHAHHQ